MHLLAHVRTPQVSLQERAVELLWRQRLDTFIAQELEKQEKNEDCLNYATARGEFGRWEGSRSGASVDHVGNHLRYVSGLPPPLPL